MERKVTVWDRPCTVTIEQTSKSIGSPSATTREM